MTDYLWKEQIAAQHLVFTCCLELCHVKHVVILNDICVTWISCLLPLALLISEHSFRTETHNFYGVFTINSGLC